jgi:hypothetical protein
LAAIHPPHISFSHVSTPARTFAHISTSWTHVSTVSPMYPPFASPLTRSPQFHASAPLPVRPPSLPSPRIVDGPPARAIHGGVVPPLCVSYSSKFNKIALFKHTFSRAGLNQDMVLLSAARQTRLNSAWCRQRRSRVYERKRNGGDQSRHTMNIYIVGRSRIHRNELIRVPRQAE